MPLSRSQHRYRGPLKAVVLDWAGTTVDFGSRAPVLAVMEAFRRIDVPVSVAEARRPMGMAKRDHLRVMLEMPDVITRWRKVFNRAPDSDDVDRLYTEFLPLQKEILAQNSQVIPGCVEAIAACRAMGIQIGSSTGYTQELMDILVPLARGRDTHPMQLFAPAMCRPVGRRRGCASKTRGGWVCIQWKRL